MDLIHPTKEAVQNITDSMSVELLNIANATAELAEKHHIIVGKQLNPAIFEVLGDKFSQSQLASTILQMIVKNTRDINPNTIYTSQAIAAFYWWTQRSLEQETQKEELK